MLNWVAPLLYILSRYLKAVLRYFYFDKTISDLLLKLREGTEYVFEGRINLHIYAFTLM